MTIPNRDEQHGGLEAVGGISRRIKDAMQCGHNWLQLTPGEQEALDIIAHKIGRILSGADPHDPEHWRDVAGYAVAARRGDGEAVPGPEAASEAEQPANQWRNDRQPTAEDAGPGSRVWTWNSLHGEFRATLWPAVSHGLYWAPGYLPAPTDSPPDSLPAPTDSPSPPPPNVIAGGDVEVRLELMFEPEQPANRWRNDRLPESGDLSEEDGTVWAWSNIDGQSCPARIRKWEAILLGGILGKIFYWAPGNLPMPTDPPPGWEPPAPPPRP